MTNPGEHREGAWTPWPDGANVRIVVRRGTEPSMVGYECDAWLFEYRCDDLAMVVDCYSWLINGKLDPTFAHRQPGLLRQKENDLRRIAQRMRSSSMRDWSANLSAFMADYRTRVMYGAHVVLHKRDPNGDACDIFGRCHVDFAGFLNSAQFFDGSFGDLLEPLARHPIDEIDLALVVDRMAPLWQKMAAYVMAKRTDGMVGDD